MNATMSNSCTRRHCSNIRVRILSLKLVESSGGCHQLEEDDQADRSNLHGIEVVIVGTGNGLEARQFKGNAGQRRRTCRHKGHIRPRTNRGAQTYDGSPERAPGEGTEVDHDIPWMKGEK